MASDPSKLLLNNKNRRCMEMVSLILVTLVVNNKARTLLPHRTTIPDMVVKPNSSKTTNMETMLVVDLATSKAVQTTTVIHLVHNKRREVMLSKAWLSSELF